MHTFRFFVLSLLTFGIICLSHLPGDVAQANVQNNRSLNAPVSVSYRYYPITGNTASELRSQMSQRGPIDKHEGRRYDANTRWVVRWSYRYAHTGNQCKIRSANTTVAITFTMPQWKSSSNVERSLVSDWRAYLASLYLHEEGHKLSGVNAGQDISQALNQLPAYSSCKGLESAIQSTAQSIIKQYNQKDIDYDQVTRHGYTQGAVFPRIATVSR